MTDFRLPMVSTKYSADELMNALKRFDIKCKGRQRVGSLPSDVEKVIIKNKTITVILTNGDKSKVECHNGDEFDVLVGFTHAYYKAKYGKCFDLRGTLNSCIQSANKKGYKQAILKNYE